MHVDEDGGNAQVQQNGQDHPENEVEIDRLEDLTPLVARSFV